MCDAWCVMCDLWWVIFDFFCKILNLWVKRRPKTPHMGSLKVLLWPFKMDYCWQSYIHYILQDLLNKNRQQNKGTQENQVMRSLEPKEPRQEDHSVGGILPWALQNCLLRTRHFPEGHCQSPPHPEVRKYSVCMWGWGWRWKVLNIKEIRKWWMGQMAENNNKSTYLKINR